MKINRLQINGFGSILNKQVELKEGINLIQGKNESGKSTLVKFIIGMLYGISKNKRGKNITDFDKYKPWDSEQYSGKITYTLDNGSSYEVYREFKKKNPEIFNEMGDNITALYSSNKTNGSMFFQEQTNVDELLFLTSTAVLQEEVKIDSQSQNQIIQRISNLTGTGEDKISYQKCIERLNKRLLIEVGTERSQDRPINLIKERREGLKREKEDLNKYLDKKYEIEEKRKELENYIQKYEYEIEILKRVEKIQRDTKLEEERISLNEEIKQNYEEKIIQLNEKIKGVAEKQKYVIKKVNNINWIIAFTLSFIILFGWIFMPFLGKCIVSIGIVGVIYFLYKGVKEKKRIKREIEKIQKIEKEREEEKTKIENEIELLQKSKEEKEQNIQIMRKDLQDKMKSEIQIIIKQDKEILDRVEKDNIEEEIERIQQNLNESYLNLHQLELDKKDILPKLENLIHIEEELIEIQEKEKELIAKNDSIELAKEVISEAYLKMKENITPQFTKELSETIHKISGGRYQKVKINEENDLVVELKNGAYAPIDILSVGTVDQLYLSLRIAILKNIAEETLPIIFDETFVYYDSERLKSTLQFINEEIKNQILLFSCTDREEKILKEMNIPFHKIEIL